MRAVVQRVSRASVAVEGHPPRGIGSGLVVLLGIAPGDGRKEIDWMVRKILGLRIFDDQSGVMNVSVRDTQGALLIVSQFTLYADTSRGNRPGFSASAPYTTAYDIYTRFVDALRLASSLVVETGFFGQDMRVDLSNEGPVTLILDSP